MISLGSLASDVRIKQLFSKVIQFHYSHLTIVTDKNLPSKKIEKRTTQELSFHKEKRNSNKNHEK